VIHDLAACAWCSVTIAPQLVRDTVSRPRPAAPNPTRPWHAYEGMTVPAATPFLLYTEAAAETSILVQSFTSTPFSKTCGRRGGGGEQREGGGCKRVQEGAGGWQEVCVCGDGWGGGVRGRTVTSRSSLASPCPSVSVLYESPSLTSLSCPFFEACLGLGSGSGLRVRVGVGVGVGVGVEVRVRALLGGLALVRDGVLEDVPCLAAYDSLAALEGAPEGGEGGVRGGEGR
jgi:hypothetical protein